MEKADLLPIGTEVTIREDLILNKVYGAWRVTANMMKYRGMVAKVIGHYIGFSGKDGMDLSIDNGHDAWSIEMFEKHTIDFKLENLDNIQLEKNKKKEII